MQLLLQLWMAQALLAQTPVPPPRFARVCKHALTTFVLATLERDDCLLTLPRPVLVELFARFQIGCEQRLVGEAEPQNVSVRELRPLFWPLYEKACAAVRPR